MNFLLDTCVLSDFFKKTPSIIANFKKVSPHQIFVSTITVMEIEYGLLLNPERALKIRPVWEKLLKAIHVVSFSQECAIVCGQIRAHLKKMGTPIGPFDLLIAATATAHDMTMVTSNMREFKRVPEITLVDWKK